MLIIGEAVEGVCWEGFMEKSLYFLLNFSINLNCSKKNLLTQKRSNSSNFVRFNFPSRFKKYDSHSVTFTILKCTVEWFLSTFTELGIFHYRQF